MNEIRRIGSEAEEIARVRAVMDEFAMPAFVTGYSVRLGEFDDEPAMWISFVTNQEFPESQEQLMAVGGKLADLTAAAYDHLRENYPARYPYFRFGPSSSIG